MNKNIKKSLQWLLRHALTVFSCVAIIALGMGAVAYSSTSTTIGENISTNGILTVLSNSNLATTTISGGDLIVDTNTLFVDNDNNRVGIGTTLPFAKLSVEQNAGETRFSIGSSTTTNFIVDKNGYVGIGTDSPSEKLTIVGNMTVDNSIFYDYFERADQTGLGNSPTGQVWSLSGAGYLDARIEDGRYISDGNTYAGIVISPKPIRIGGRFSFTDSAKGFALISSADSSITLQHILHLYFDFDSYTLTWWDGEDQNNALLSGSHGTVPWTLETDGTVYEIWMTIVGDTVHLDLPNGSSADYYDPHVSSLSGSLGIWQVTGSGARWESVGSSQVATSTVYGQITASGGIQGTPIGSINPSVVYANRIGVGTTSPLAALHVDNQNLSTDAAIIQSNINTVLRLKTTGSGYSPALIFDENYSNPPKIYSLGNAQDIRISTQNTDRMVFPAYGAGVGIGTATPKSTVDIVGSLSIGAYGGISAAPSNGLIVSGNVGIGTTSPAYKLDVNGVVRADDYYSGDYSQGQTTGVVVKGSDGIDCTLTFKDGLLTAETCP